jgi:hypothetical protein
LKFETNILGNSFILLVRECTAGSKKVKMGADENNFET